MSAAFPRSGQSSNAALHSIAEMRSLRRADGALARTAANASAARLGAGRPGDRELVIVIAALLEAIADLHSGSAGRRGRHGHESIVEATWPEAPRWSEWRAQSA